MRYLIGVFAAGLVLMAATVSAQAQGAQQSSINANTRLGQHASDASKNAQDAAKVKANDKAYNAALQNIPDKQYDPWRGVR
jgi:TolA-binding protein